MCVCGDTDPPLCVRKGLWHVPGWSWWDCGVSGGGHCAMSWAVLGSLVCPPGRWAAVCPLVMLGRWPWCVPWDGGTGSVACPQGAQGIAAACAPGCGEGCGLSGAGGGTGHSRGGCWVCAGAWGAGAVAACEEQVSCSGPGVGVPEGRRVGAGWGDSF